MAAAVAKLCDVHELVFVARKMPRTSRARTTLGGPRHAVVAVAAQPSDRRSARHDAVGLLGPVAGRRRRADRRQPGHRHGRERHGGVCASRQAAPGRPARRRRSACWPTSRRSWPASSAARRSRSCFKAWPAPSARSLASSTSRSICSTTATARWTSTGRWPASTDQFMYFETGQGSEFTYGKHNGIDMATAEALCYGLARRYDPFMVNNVTGFIGPETHLDNFEMILANLQDHFMGKLLGLPMGMAPCYTLHSQITLEGQQMATRIADGRRRQLLHGRRAQHRPHAGLFRHQRPRRPDAARDPRPPARAGVSRLGHRARHICPRGRWSHRARARRGATLGSFARVDDELRALIAATPAAHGFATAGPRPADAVSRQVRMHQAVGREAIHAELDVAALARVADFRVLSSAAATKQEHLDSPDLGAAPVGRRPGRASARGKPGADRRFRRAQRAAVQENVPSLLPVLRDGLTAHGLRLGRPMLVRYGRVKLAEQIALAVGCDLVVFLVGERPGGDEQAARSLSAYLVFRLHDEPARRGFGLAAIRIHDRLEHSGRGFTRPGSRRRDRGESLSHPGVSGCWQSAGSDSRPREPPAIVLRRAGTLAELRREG